MKQAIAAIVAVIAIVAAIHVGLAAPAAAQPVTLRFGQVPSTVRAVTSVYLFIAERQGFLAREGIRLEFIPIDLKGLDQVIAFIGEGGALKAPLPNAARFVDLQYLRTAGVE
jgi:hypothetical protein